MPRNWQPKARTARRNPSFSPRSQGQILGVWPEHIPACRAPGKSSFAVRSQRARSNGPFGGIEACGQDGWFVTCFTRRSIPQKPTLNLSCPKKKPARQRLSSTAMPFFSSRKESVYSAGASMVTPSLPIPSITTSTAMPALTGAAPIEVPQAIRSPGLRVMSRDRPLTICSGGRIMSAAG